METSNILNIVLGLAVVVLTIHLTTAKDSKETTSNPEEAVLTNIATRTSIRTYENKTIEKDKIEKMLKAAMAAPTAMNKQPWHFLVVTDKTVLKSLASANPNASMLATAPLAIVVCGDMDKAIEGGGRDFWIQDASAATQNLLLAAHALGLGAVWTGTYPSPDRCAAVTTILHLPANLIPLNTIVIGYPAESPKPKDKFKQENITYNIYSKN